MKTVEIITDNSNEAFIIRIPEMMGIRPETVGTLLYVLGGLPCHYLHVVGVRNIKKYYLLTEIPEERQLPVG